jgi:ABC-type Fe3+-hydroxamate transport system substrate-binding protein
MRVWQVATLALLAALSTLGAWTFLRQPARETRALDGSRIVSLSPSITETLFAIGAAERVVGVSNYCTYPPQAATRPRVGTGLTPSYEAIARLAPTLVVTENNANVRAAELRALAPTLLLPWLSLAEIALSVRRLGAITGRQHEADALADRLSRRLGVLPPANGPRVLLVLGYDPSRLDEVWFIRKNSLHGAALHAALGRNAVDEAVTGLPRLSLQRVIELDPDIIILLVLERQRGDPLAAWRKLEPLRAVRDNRLSVIEAPEAFANGPRILDLTERLAREIERLRPR